MQCSAFDYCVNAMTKRKAADPFCMHLQWTNHGDNDNE